MDWELVGYSSHPIPGDPDVVASQTQHLASVAASLRSQADALRTSGSGSLVWDSDAAPKFFENVKSLPDDLELAATRYERVSSAMVTFGPVLRNTRAQAEEGLQEAVAANADLQTAQSGLTRQHEFNHQAKQIADQWNQQYPDQPPKTPEAWPGPDYATHVSDAQARLHRATTKVHTAVSAFHTAANTAKDAVHDADHDSLKNKPHHWWDSVAHAFSGAVHFVTNHLADIATVLGDISAVCGVLALLPIPGFDVVMAGVSLAAGGLALGCDVANMAITGDWSWGKLAFDTVGVVLGATGLGAFRALGAGRFLDGAIESSRGLTNATKGAAQASTKLAGASAKEAEATDRLAGAEAQGYTAAAGREAGAVGRDGRPLAGAAQRSHLVKQVRTARSGLQSAADESEKAAQHLRNLKSLRGIRTGDKLVAAGGVANVPATSLADGKNPITDQRNAYYNLATNTTGAG